MVKKYSAEKGRKVNSKGRGKHGPRFLQLHHYLLHCEAWRSLKPVRRSIYIEIAQRFNGSNNGEISFSVREAASCVHCSKDTASEAFHELEEKGFIRRNICGSFNYKLRHATTWILTQHPHNGESPTKDFMKWKPVNLKTSLKARTDCPKQRTEGFVSKEFDISTVPLAGPKH